ncbi:MAG: dephospho-CoA kinase [Armatimonadota bacterium]|jgi:dephospho-CoA kinase
MIVIGVIGPIAAGKSVVLDELAGLGAETIRADEVSRELLAPGSDLLDEVIADFGNSFRGEVGGLDRAKLGALVFGDDSARRRLERIVHPAMVRRIAEKIARFREAGVRVVAVEAANLVEMDALPLVDLTVMVTAPEDVRIERLMQRDGLSEAEAQSRLALHRRLGIENHPTDYRIDTSGGEQTTRRQAQRLWRETVE